jgi:hypothetical protein
MKFTANRPYADPEVAARKLIEFANSVEAVQDGRIFIELLNGPFLFDLKGTPARIPRGAQSSGRAPLAGEARIRDLREVYPGWG